VADLLTKQKATTPMPIDTFLLLTFTLLTIAVVVVVVLYTFVMHHVRTTTKQASLSHQPWLVDVALACVPWLIVSLLMYPTLKKIFTQS
jgi:heme/copper-type cytochrome/quinol oxidase subunit 2